MSGFWQKWLGSPLKSVRELFSFRLALCGVVLAVGALVATVATFGKDLEAIGVATFVGLASSAVGCVAGFLFGVPKLGEEPGAGGSGIAATDSARLTTAKLVANSNLGQVSDWVTKIVIGLGIAQFGKLLDGIAWLGRRFPDVFDGSLDDGAASAYGVCLVIASFAISFLLMYMWTATRLPDVWGPQPS